VYAIEVTESHEGFAQDSSQTCGTTVGLLYYYDQRFR
jgi:hypothetical protein